MRRLLQLLLYPLFWLLIKLEHGIEFQPTRFLLHFSGEIGRGMTVPFREGARHLLDPCPKCAAPCIFSSDFSKFGKHQIRACLSCRAVYHNGKAEGVIEVPPPVDPGTKSPLTRLSPE